MLRNFQEYEWNGIFIIRDLAERTTHTDETDCIYELTQLKYLIAYEAVQVTTPLMFRSSWMNVFDVKHWDDPQSQFL